MCPDSSQYCNKICSLSYKDFFLSYLLNSRYSGYKKCIILTHKYLYKEDMERSYIYRKGLFYILSKDLLPTIQTRKTLDTIYKNPHLVPWNMIPREYYLVNKIIENNPKGSRILEIGMGYGKNLFPLKRAGFDIFGLDISKDAIEMAFKVLGNENKLFVSSVLSLPFDANSFSAVLDVGCLHYIDNNDLIRALAEIARVLKPGACIYSRYYYPAEDNKKTGEKRVSLYTGIRKTLMRGSVEKYFDIIESNEGIRMGTIIAWVRK